MTHFLVVANGHPPSAHLLEALLKQHDQLVAVDGGFYTCLQYGLEPHLLIGDFDSISMEKQKKFARMRQVKITDQNKSDLEKTLAFLFESGAKYITVCAAVGKRIDHTLSNMHLLAQYPMQVKFETDIEICFALNRSSSLSCQIGQILSLIPLSTSVKNVLTTGLEWELKGQTLNKNFVSISNICRQNTITVTFEEGDLIACLVKPGKQ